MAIKYNVLPQMLFPSTKMDSINKLITEGNLTRLINKLIDTDSYIIPPKGIDLSDYVSIDSNTVVKVDTNISYEDLEFVINGYYFNLGPIHYLIYSAKEEILNSQLSLNNFILSAQIKISTDSENGGKYPELFGETLINKTLKQQFPTSATITESELPNIKDFNLGDKPITKIEFFHLVGDEEVIDGVGSYDSNGVILKPSGLEFDTNYDYFYTIEYKDYSSMITLYIRDIDEDIQSEEDSTYILPQDIKNYSIDLLIYKNSNTYIPMNNFAKFGHQSISSIDGGEF